MTGPRRILFLASTVLAAGWVAGVGIYLLHTGAEHIGVSGHRGRA